MTSEQRRVLTEGRKAAEWQSFEELRLQHAAHLALIGPRDYAELKVKRQRYAIMHTHRHNALCRAAAELEKIRDSAQMLVDAAAFPDGVRSERLIELCSKMLLRDINTALFHAEDAGRGSLAEAEGKYE